MSTESVVLSNHLILCHSLLLLSSIFPSIMFFPNEWVLRFRWPKYWSFSFSVSPSSKYSEWISFRIDWLDLLAVLGSLKSLLQNHNCKVSTLPCSAFTVCQLYLNKGLIKKNSCMLLVATELQSIPLEVIFFSNSTLAILVYFIFYANRILQGHLFSASRNAFSHHWTY